MVSGQPATPGGPGYLAHSRLFGAPGRIRTYGLRFRKPTLYPLSYGGVVRAPTSGSRCTDLNPAPCEGIVHAARAYVACTIPYADVARNFATSLPSRTIVERKSSQSGCSPDPRR
jgi:hypothetical protein